MNEDKKSLQQLFLEGEKINVLDELIIKTLQYCTDCDGMCGLSCDIWYCESKRASLNTEKYNQ